MADSRRLGPRIGLFSLTTAIVEVEEGAHLNLTAPLVTLGPGTRIGSGGGLNVSQPQP